MSSLFLKILNMSISASWLVLAILLLRHVLKKAPKWIRVVLWGVVAFRLICPFTMESVFSLIPDFISSGELVSEWMDDYVGEVSIIYENSIHYNLAAAAGREPVSDGEGGYYVVTKYDLGEPPKVEDTVIPAVTTIWASGAALMVLYTVISYMRLKKKVSTAIPIQHRIYQSENVSSPFVFGIIKPKIYLPYNIKEQELNHVIAHEQAHILRKDHWWKPLGFLLLAVHWFNPVIWLAYVLLCRDIELACDEKVITKLGNEQRADYTRSLLTCSVNHPMIAACPLAFGEVGVKERVKSVMNYQRPAFWMVMMAAVTCVVLAVCFLTNPKEERFDTANTRSKTELLCCRAVSEQSDQYIEPVYYPDEFDGDYENLPIGTIGKRGSLLFTADWDTDTLVVSEEYYKKHGGTTKIEKETYTLKPNEKGVFELEVSVRDDDQIEEAFYFIQAEAGVYAMKIIYGIDHGRLETSLYPDGYIHEASNAVRIAQLLPYPRDYHYSSSEVQNSAKHNVLLIYLDGKEDVKREDFESSAIAGFIELGDVDIISFCDARSQEVITSFSRSAYERKTAFFLFVGAENIKSIEYVTLNSDGVLEKEDGSLFHKGERIRLDFLEGYQDLGGVEIFALGEAGEVLWNISFSETDRKDEQTWFREDDWCIFKDYDYR